MSTASQGAVAWLLETTNQLLRCRSTAALLDVAYEAIHGGLGYDRVGLMLVDEARQVLVVHIGTDAWGQKFYPRDRQMPLCAGSFHAALLADARMQSTGQGFVYFADTSAEVSPEVRHGLDGRPGPSLQVAMRAPEKIVGLLSVDNLPSARPVLPELAAPLVAFANALACAMDNVSLLEERGRRIESLDIDLHQRVAHLSLLQEAGTQLALLHDLDAVLDTIYDCVHTGLGFDRVGLFLIEPDSTGRLVEREVRGCDEQGRQTRVCPAEPAPIDDPDLAEMSPDLYHLLQGHAYFYCPDRWAITPPAARPWLTGKMREQLAVALRHDNVLIGYISVDNLLSGRPLSEADAPSLVALAAQAALAISRAKLWEAHAAARAVAEAAVRMRNDVLAAVSHDLKNPLTAIMGQAQLLEMPAQRAPSPTAGQLGAGLMRIQANARKMARLLNEMLDAVQVEAGDTLALERRPTDLGALARRTAEEYVTASTLHSMTFEGVPDPLVGDWDAFRLERVLGNLLSNAVKYSPEGGEVRVRIAQDGAEWAVLEVQDDGQGIPAAALPHVFDRFYRATNVRRGAGTGIGLAVVRHIVEQHGGSVVVRSQVGVGTTVTVRLPLLPGGLGTPVPQPEADGVVGEAARTTG